MSLRLCRLLRVGYKPIFRSLMDRKTAGLPSMVKILYCKDTYEFLLQQKKKQEEERNALRKEVVALRIMQSNYEQMVKAQQSQPSHTEQRVSDEFKFQVPTLGSSWVDRVMECADDADVLYVLKSIFRASSDGLMLRVQNVGIIQTFHDALTQEDPRFQNIIEQLFTTFSNISVNNFPELSACVFSWLEEHCKPQTLREMVINVLQRLTSARHAVGGSGQ